MVPTLVRNSSLAETLQVSAISKYYYLALKRVLDSSGTRSGRQYLLSKNACCIARLPVCEHLGGVAYRESETVITSKQRWESAMNWICDAELKCFRIQREE